MNAKVLIIDHFDSFTYNLVQYIGELGANSEVIRTNTKLAELKKLAPTHVVLSPGYGHPNNVNCFLDAIKYWKNKIPILGVCLGHQAIALSVGTKIIKSERVMHGKRSYINHNGASIFHGLPSPFIVGRYHSLIVNSNGCEKNGLETIAWTDKDEIMAIRLKNNHNVIGVQFHPESILTENGKKLLLNFLELN